MRFLTRLIARCFRRHGLGPRSELIRASAAVAEVQTEAAEDDCVCEPLEVPDEEYIARAVYFDFHLRNDRTLKWQAFRAPRGKDDLSTMRTRCIDASRCKSLARALNEPHKSYEGFALLLTGAIRSEGFKVHDSRRVFCGHADLHLNNPLFGRVELPDAEPPDDITYRAQERRLAERLIAHSFLRIDPSPNEEGWPVETPWLPN